MTIARNSCLVFSLLLFLSCSSETVVKTNTPLSEEDFTAYSGLIAPSAGDYLKMEEAKMIRSFADASETEFARLPPSIDLSAGLPRVADQGKQNSCAGWALSFAVKSFQENRELGWGLNEEHLFSPSFIYNQLNGGKDEGVDLLDAMNFIVENGTVPYRLMPYREDDIATQPDERLKELAKGFKGLGYRRIDEKNMDHIRAYLAGGEPVLLVLEMFENFLPRGMRASGNIYKEKKGDSLGHHALVAVGYDNAKNAIKLMNSWGARWGEKGYGWLDYSFAPQVIEQAFVLYDLPTPLKALDRYSVLVAQMPQVSLPPPGHEISRETDLAGKKTGEELKAGAPGLEREMILLVPDESGIAYGKDWLRLASPMGEAKDFFSEKKSPLFKDMDIAFGNVRILEDLLNKGFVGKMQFYPDPSLPVYTNEGVTFGSSKEDVRRIYGPPDFADGTANEETWFFHAVVQNWGGIRLTQHASLVFHYDADDRVNYLALESAFKKVKLGKGFEEVKEGEQQRLSDGTLIKSDDGQIEFVVPSQFSDIKKSVWEGTGYGYFITNPNDPYEYLNVKVFEAAGEVTDELLTQRIAADLKIFGASSASLVTRRFAGIDWRYVSTDGAIRYYGAKGKNIYQLIVASPQDPAKSPWAESFLESFVIR
ncbi:MAG: C1 family peptidase [Deltaproteobacteria bacterium]|nr:C1 family peptidase [Deltaproteobacteria bacterium]